ncbi:FAD-binding oxidoreductase [Roseibium sp. SCP14]|uniref:FAD-binding oxidoreductase n=1 Tax=Roseibium sp. SCP14 TaxID=3141375 RepID=UPI0033370E9F
MTSKALSDHLLGLLGPNGWLTKDIERYQADWLNRRSPQILGVARPATTEEVSAVLRLAHDANVPVTPQGGNTGLCMGSVPENAGAIILSLSRMRRIVSVDPQDFAVTVEAGVVLADLNGELENHGLMLPMHLGSEGSAQIGGLIATNAGGSHALRYGMMQDLVLGLEAVLPDGSIWNGNRSLLKDNAGYQLRRLFCGSEGTLGVVTKAVLRLYPKPRQRAAALIALEDFQAAVGCGAGLRREFGEFISALEFFTETGLDLVLKNISDLSFPLETRSPVYMLVELSSSSASVNLMAMLETALGEAYEQELILDGVIASNEAQRLRFWRLREEMPEGQRLEGAQIKHDIAVPPSRLDAFVSRTCAGLKGLMPGLRINLFGHLGDGNIHFNLSPPPGVVEFGDKGDGLSHFIYSQTTAAGGSIAAEHGLGRTKLQHADTLRSPVERRLMRLIKTAIDPKDVMNPGVIVRRNLDQE